MSVGDRLIDQLIVNFDRMSKAMTYRWGFANLVLCWALVFSPGCATGPGDVAVTEPSAESEIVQVSNNEPSGSGKGEFLSTASGLKYKVIKEGKGRRPNANSTVTCHYRGWLDNGKEFDSSYGKNAATFPLSGVIKGWTEGLQLIQEGGKIELEIPSELGYGASGSPPAIPPGATLHFEVELFKVR